MARTSQRRSVLKGFPKRWCNGFLDFSAAGTGSPILESLVRLNVPGEAPSPQSGVGDSAGAFLQLLATPSKLSGMPLPRMARYTAMCLRRFLQRGFGTV
jgi:hypothetical protein